MAFNPTVEQEKAINAKGNILVAAAAGSGKTAVLVERVIKRLCSKTDHISADRLLIVTFTNAAAAEMRSRIEQRLDEECNKNPDDISIKMQKYLLSSAKICTIDSFCIDLVRENFERLNISPDFKIGDDLSLKPIDERVLNNIINRYLEEDNPIFSRLLDIVGTEYDEGNFLQFIFELYNYSRQLPFPKKWFKAFGEFYNNGVFSEECPWAIYAFELAESITSKLCLALENAKELLFISEKAQDAYSNVFDDAFNALSKLNIKSKSRDWDAFFTALDSFKVPSLPSVRGLSDIQEITAAKSIYSSIGKSLERLEKIFFANKSFFNSQFEFLYEPVCLLGDILCEFDTTLFEEYRKNNTFTFHNTEHLALQLLCAEADGKLVINPDSLELINRFDEVMVDEYQDTNDLQDMLFYVLSNRESRLFVVGDVKQSIYGFRGANPKNFLGKKNRYTPFEIAEEGMPKKIILGNNFRCAPRSCEFINFFFKLFMNDETGDIVYNSEEELVASACYPEITKPSCEAIVIDCAESERSTAEDEAIKIADYIEETMRDGNVIRESDTVLRPAKYSDFAILVRSAKLKAPVIAEELKRRNIPVNYTNESFIETTEISTFLKLLCVIENPATDVELLSVMMSPIFMFSAEEMANIRADCKQGSLYSAVVKAAGNKNSKAEKFLQSLEKYRLLSAIMPLKGFVSRLLNETGYLDMVSLMSEGEKRRANLLLLCSYAEKMSEEGYLSPQAFAKRLIRHSGSGRLQGAAVSGGDAVRIMNIHTSKGLQFPICILAGLSSAFYDNDSKKSILYSTDFGIGFRYFDEVSKQKLTTISREVLLDRSRAVSLEEELRLFYVAMTRTQDRLVFVTALNNCEKKLSELSSLLISTDKQINSYLFSKTKSYSDWLLLALLLHPCGKVLRTTGGILIPNETDSEIAVRLLSANSSAELQNNTEKPQIMPNSELLTALNSSVNYEYPFKELTELEAKASVSRLANSAESAKYAFSTTPAFMNSGDITAAERGTALHKVMQFLDFSNAFEIEAELDRLYEMQFISERERDSIDVNKLKRFFKSNVFSRMQASEQLHRELRFLTEIPAETLNDRLSDEIKNEKIIVQGAVDVCFIEEDGIVILDFKTDRVTSADKLTEAYGEQLEFYAKACEKIFEMPVKQKIIYSFNLGEEIVL